MSLPLIPTPRRELVAAGLGDRDVDVMLQTGRAKAPFRGIIVDAAVALDLLARCRAALATQDEDAAVGHETAAALLRLAWLPPMWSLPDAGIHVVVQRDDQHRHRNGLRLHRALLPDSDVTLVAGLRCTAPSRTLVDLARRRDANRLLIVQLVDGALRMQKCGSADLDAALGAAAGLRNVARAR